MENGHAQRFRDTFATGLLLQGVSLGQYQSYLLTPVFGLQSGIMHREVRSRQEQHEAYVRRIWEAVANATKGTPEAHGKPDLLN